MTKIVYFFALVALVQVASALDCYSCDKNSCQQEMGKWQTVNSCGKAVATPNLTGACLKQVFTDPATSKEVTIRKCVIADKKPDSQVTYNCNPNDGKIISCEVCTNDLCNSASAVNFSFVTFLGVIAVYLIPKFM